MILFLDACAVIDLIESEATFHARVVATLRDLRQRFPDARLAVSRLSLLECLLKPMRDGATELIAEYRAFFAAGDLLVVELDAGVLELALTLRARDGLRTPGALQLDGRDQAGHIALAQAVVEAVLIGLPVSSQ